jgi:hypothetical protein
MKVAVIGLAVIVLLAFFFIPVILVASWRPPVNTAPYPIYGSLGCVVMGLGDTYALNALNWQGLHFGCHVPPQPTWNSTLG